MEQKPRQEEQHRHESPNPSPPANDHADEEEDSVAYPPFPSLSEEEEEVEVALPAPAGLLGSCDRCARPAVYKGGHGVTFCEKHRCQGCLGDPRPHVTMAGKTTCIKCSETKKREREADGEEKEPKRRRIHQI